MNIEKMLSVVIPVYNEKETIRIRSDGFSVEPELTAKICKNKQ